MFKLLFSANLRDSLVAKTQRLNSVVDHLFVVDIANGPTQKEYYIITPLVHPPRHNQQGPRT